jgi:hypothetical protein
VTKRTDVLERNAAGEFAGSSYEILCEPVLFQFGKGIVLRMLYDLTRLGSIFPSGTTFETRIIIIFIQKDA